MSQQFSAIGQIATDPKFFTPAGGAEFCTFRLASGERRYDAAKQEWVDADTNWFTVNTFRSLARHTERSLRKGDRVVVSGKLRVRQWANDDKRGTSVEIDADGLGHDLRFGVSSFRKTTGSDGRGGSGQDHASADRPGTTGAEQQGPIAGRSKGWAPPPAPTGIPQESTETAQRAADGSQTARRADETQADGSQNPGTQAAGGKTGGGKTGGDKSEELTTDGFTPKLASA